VGGIVVVTHYLSITETVQDGFSRFIFSSCIAVGVICSSLFMAALAQVLRYLATIASKI